MAERRNPMKQNDLKELRKEYESVSMSEDQAERMKEEMKRAAHEKNKNRKIILLAKCAAAAAAVFIVLPNTSANVAYAMSGIPVVGRLVEVVTFRDYRYESERHTADIQTPELVVSGEEAGRPDNMQDADQAAGAATETSQTEDTLQKTTEEINEEIAKITDQIIAEFEESLKYEEGYQDVQVTSEALSTTDQYFTLKLICYQASGSGAQWNYFYTIDLNTGKKLALKDLFKDGADYITPISGNIKRQMQEQMDADENVIYWLDNEDVGEWNFDQITEETSFYINENNEIVIAFNEGDVAPMYMGCVEFVIPNEVLADIRK